MTTGKVEFAPDYKSDRRSTAEIAATHVCTDDCDPEKRLIAAAHRYVDDLRAKRTAERSRLEREVIEAARVKRRADKAFAAIAGDETWRVGVQANNRFMEAVDALLDFESKQNG